MYWSLNLLVSQTMTLFEVRIFTEVVKLKKWSLEWSLIRMAVSYKKGKWENAGRTPCEDWSFTATARNYQRLGESLK